MSSEEMRHFMLTSLDSKGFPLRTCKRLYSIF
jgi:hypothetical protein